MKTPTPYTDAFLEDLKIKMQDLKLKKASMARAVGTSKQTANRWFHGLRKPNGEFILKIQAWLKTKISIFL